VFAADFGAPEPEAESAGSATELDRDALMFIAVHRAVLAEQVKTLLDFDEPSVHELLVGLAAAGMVKHQLASHRHPGVSGITRRGLSLIDSDLPVPYVASRAYQHDIDVAWLWLAVHAGTFGRFEQFLSRREMQARDLAWTRVDRTDAAAGSPLGDRSKPPFGVRLPSADPQEPAQLHHADVLQIVEQGRIPIVFEDVATPRRRLEVTLSAYRADPTVRVVRYFVLDPMVGRMVQSAADRLGLARFVHVQPVRKR
jgi:hypothetical protein